jgi:hypothetical protein
MSYALQPKLPESQLALRIVGPVKYDDDRTPRLCVACCCLCRYVASADLGVTTVLVLLSAAAGCLLHAALITGGGVGMWGRIRL